MSSEHLLVIERLNIPKGIPLGMIYSEGLTYIAKYKNDTNFACN